MIEQDLKRETDEMLREVFRRLEDRFGSFAEDLAFSCMTKILFENFKMNVVMRRPRALHNGRWMELDLLAYSNAPAGEAFIVQIENHLLEDRLDRMHRVLREFREFFPGHTKQRGYGILAAVHIPEEIRERVLREGIYLVQIHDDRVEFKVPDGFQPRAF